MILLIDNYDSFSYNLYQYLGELDPGVRVVRNDAVDAATVRTLAPSHIVISPGPGRPADAGNCEEIVRELSGVFPILGVCLGHQAICEAFGARVGHAQELMHGKQSLVRLDASCPLFAGLPAEAEVARYHSLAVEEGTLPSCLRVVARAPDGEVMAVQHAEHPTFGVQFHPESIMTPHGKQMLRNFRAIGENEADETAPQMRQFPRGSVSFQEGFGAPASRMNETLPLGNCLISGGIMPYPQCLTEESRKESNI